MLTVDFVLDGQEFTAINGDPQPGASMFATRALWERVGMFDDRYFLLFEASDWCARAHGRC